MKKYAVVMTCTTNLIKCLNTAINGLNAYGNDVDIHVLGFPLPKEYLANLPDNCICPPTDPLIDADKPNTKPWHVRFIRYKYAGTLSGYDAVAILDADCLVIDNIMEHFEMAAQTGKLILPYNTRGWTLGKIDSAEGRGLHVQSAVTPPYHCHPFFFDPKKYKWLMDEVYEWGGKEPFGDMATLFRTLYRHNMHRDVHALPGQLYVFTDWYFDMIRYSQDASGAPCLNLDARISTNFESGSRMKVIHRRWALPPIRAAYMFGKGKCTPGPLHINNMEAMMKAIKWFDENGSAKWAPYVDPKYVLEWNTYENYDAYKK